MGSFILCDNFEHLATGDMGGKYTDWSPGAIVSGEGSSVPFFNGNALLTTGNTDRAARDVALSDIGSRLLLSVIVGGVFMVRDPDAGGPGIIAALYSGTAANCSLVVDSDARLGIGAGTPVGGTFEAKSSHAVMLNAWYHFEWVVNEVSNAVGAGTHLVYINDELWITNSGGEDFRAASDVIDRVAVGKTNNESWDVFHDHWYAIDPTCAVSARLGPTRMYTLRPLSDGSVTDFTALGGGSNVLEIDEATPDGDTTYNHASTANDNDRYIFTKLSAAGAPEDQPIHFAQLNLVVERDDAVTAREIECIVSSPGGVSSVGDQAASFLLCNAYETRFNLFSNDPDGGAWEVSTIDQSEWGIALTA